MNILRHLGRHLRSSGVYDAKLVAVAFACFLGIIFVAWKFDQQQTRIASIAERKNVDELGEQLAHSIENELNKRLVAVDALAALQAMRPDIGQTDFNDFASELDAQNKHMIALQLAPNGVVRYTTHIERNQKAIGHDILNDARYSEEAFNAINTGDYTIVGPVDLIQGGTALIARKPIFNNDQFGLDNFWGFSIVLVDFDAITDLLTQSKTFANHEYALRSEGKIIWGNPEVFDLAPCLMDVALTAGQWQLAIAPKAGWATTWPFASHFRIASLLIAVLLSFMLFHLMRRPYLLRQAVVAATAELTKTTQKLREVLGIAQLGAWEVDSDCNVSWSHEAIEILGLEKDAAGIDALHALAEKEDVAILATKMRNVPHGGARTEAVLHLKKQTGQGRTVRFTAITRENGDGGPKFEGTVQDITTQTVNSERLRRAQKLEAMGQLTGGVAHDFNNLLAVIQGNTELIEMRGRYDQGLLDEISQASRKGAALTHRLLAYARKQPLSSRPTDLATLVRGMQPLLSRSLGEDIEIETMFSSDLWLASIDPSQIEDAVLNLAINARDAMSNGGRLTIRVGNEEIDATRNLQNTELSTGQYVALEVTDTGTGMSEEVQMHVFEPFFSTKGVGGGSGLGLSMVCGLARQSGGGVHLESTVGVGTTFKVYLPRSIEQSVRNVVQLEPNRSIPKGNGELILVIEDNPSVMRVVVKKLTQLGYNSLEAETVKSARKLIENGPEFDMVLSDIVLPGGASGLDFAQRAKAEGKNLNILFMSGFPISDSMSSRDTLSEYPLLKKPFSGEELAKAIHRALRKPTTGPTTPLVKIY